MLGPKCHEGGISGNGNPDFGVMIIGLSPGSNEIYTGIPLTGPAGNLLNGLLKGVNFPRSQVYCTNLVCTKIIEPSPAEILSCASRLEKEIFLLKPKLIITLGAVVQNYFLPKYTIGKIRGCPTWSEKYNCYILATYHPGAVLYGTLAYIHDIARDLNKIQEILSWPEKTANAEIKFSIASSHEQAQKALNFYAKSEYCVVDVETKIGKDDAGEVDVYNDALLTVGVGDSNSTMVIPLELAQGLEWPDAHYTGHNFMFDVQMIRRFLNVVLPIKDDTLLMSYILDERSGIHKLKQISREYLGCGFYEENIDRKNLSGDINILAEAEYNAKDVIYTARLAKFLYKRMKTENVTWPYHNILIPASNMFADIQFRGIHIDKTIIGNLALDWGEKYLREEEKLQELAISYGWDKEFINFNSPQQLSKLLYKIMGIPGGPSTSKKVLEDLALINPFLARLICLRHITHLFNTYIIGFQDDIKFDSRVHANVLLHGQVQGRPSYTNPPLQTLPKNVNPDDPVEAEFEEFDKVIKQVYPEYNLLNGLGRVKEVLTATNDDYVIVEADFKGAELYSAVVCSGDPNMKADLESGDFHTNAAKGYYKLEHVTYAQRQDSKPVTFGRMYNRGALAISKAELKGTPLDEVQEVVNGFDERYDVYRKWSLNIMKTVETVGELTSFTGRKRRFILAIGDEKYRLLNSGINFPIQSLASDVTILASIKLHKLFKELKLDAHILLTVHDCVMFEVNKKILPEFLKLAKSVMTEPQLEGLIPVEVEIKVGNNFANCKEVKI